MKHLFLIVLIASMFSGSVFAVGETEDFECSMLAESNDRVNTKIKSEDVKSKEKSSQHGAVEM